MRYSDCALLNVTFSSVSVNKTSYLFCKRLIVRAKDFDEFFHTVGRQKSLLFQTVDTVTHKHIDFLIIKLAEGVKDEQVTLLDLAIQQKAHRRIAIIVV